MCSLQSFLDIGQMAVWWHWGSFEADATRRPFALGAGFHSVGYSCPPATANVVDTAAPRLDSRGRLAIEPATHHITLRQVVFECCLRTRRWSAVPLASKQCVWPGTFLPR